MESKLTLPSTRAAKVHPKPLALPNAAEATKKAKVEGFLQRMAMLQELQEAKAHASAAAQNRSPSPTRQSMYIYELPSGLHYISSSLKIDDPRTPMRIGQLSTFFMKMDPLTGTKHWVGLTWAEIFFPVLGERPRSVVGSKAYEVVLKQPTQDGGLIIRENVVTTGRVIGVVVADLPHEAVSVRIEDWFLKSDVFKKGRWNQLDAVTRSIRARDVARADLAIP